MFFLVPLVLWPYTSEVFEFNKIVLVYIFTTLITGTWVIRMITENKIILRRTILDTPLLVFLLSQLISTLFSIDPSTSWLGYYSRFNGGMYSLFCYAILYWGFVSNIDSKQTIKTLYWMLISAVLVSIYGILEHFGIDKSVWVQDVQSRVFSTLGQPNWLAAYLVALLPIVFTFQLPTYKKLPILNYLISILFFITLLFTKSRSGLAGIGVAVLIYWGAKLFKSKFKLSKDLFVYNLLFLAIALIIGTQLTPSISAILFKSKEGLPTVAAATEGPALETGGTESGTIRKIVWKGAVDIWSHYPVFGTGLETFAFSYYQFRPLEHNTVSEWDFIYNKAHNEYLNYAANTGTFGLGAYLVLVGFTIYQFIKLEKYEYLAGYVGVLVTNFFGFSVVPTELQLFMFPAIAITLKNE